MSGAANSDVQYVAYLKAKFNLADADLLQVIALSQRPTPTRSVDNAPETEEEVEVADEEEKEEVGGMMDASAYEEEVMDESVEEVVDDSYEELEYVDESLRDNNSPAPTPAPIPISSPSPVTEEPMQEESEYVVESASPSAQGEEVARTVAPDPDAATPTTSNAVLPVVDAPHDEIEENLVPAEDNAPLIYPHDTTTQDAENMPGKDEPTKDDPNAMAIVPAKSQAMVPVPEQAPPLDMEEGRTKAAAPPATRDEPEEKKSSTLLIIALCCVLLLIGVVIVLVLMFATDIIPKFWEDDPVTMEPYDPNSNCNFDGQAQPNFANQCECSDRVTRVNSWTQTQYERLTTDFIPNIDPNWNLQIDSCEPANQALLWLSTGEEITDQQALTRRYVLAFLYFSTAGPNWRARNNWLSEENVCEWFGTTCTGSDIQQISLPNNRLNGEIPSELNLLTQLETVALDQNRLESSVPTEIFSISSLRSLTVGTNRLVGTIPTQVGLATQLQTLRLNDNLFRGSVPSQLNRLTRLVSLSLEGNTQLIGRIATEYGSFTNLQSLSLSRTGLRARLPTEYGRLRQLQELKIAETLVGGDLPTQLEQLTRLRILDLTGSRFRQELPTFLGELTDLSTLLLGNNEFEGEIPSELGALTGLRVLELHENDLTGPVPTELSNLRNLVNFTLYGNPYLTGNMPTEVCVLTDRNLKNFTVDCPTREFGVLCPLRVCCTSCVDLPEEEEDEEEAEP